MRTRSAIASVSWRTHIAASLEGATLTLPEGDAYEYSGGEQRPMVKVVLPTGDLREGVDYTVSYSNNVDVGTASFLVTGIGGCFGTASGTFAITRASLADASIAPIPDQTLASPEVRPDLVVTLVGRTLSQGVDYDVAYSNNTGLGTATATVTGKGNYEGVKSATFRIVAMAGTWKGSGSKWWYQWKDGKYPTSVFLDISGKTYYFDASGYCVYGWRQIDKKYYYFESSGAMAKSKWVGNYWLKADGTMATSEWVDGGRYWVGADGAWVRGKTR